MTISIADVELCEQGQALAVGVALGKESRLAPVPSVTQTHTDGILIFLQQRGDVVGLLLQPPVVAGIARSEIGVPDALSVEEEFV